MSLIVVKILIRIFGTLCGLSGAFTLYVSLMMSVESFSSPEHLQWVVLGFFLAMGVYFVYWCGFAFPRVPCGMPAAFSACFSCHLFRNFLKDARVRSFSGQPRRGFFLLQVREYAVESVVVSGGSTSGAIGSPVVVRRGFNVRGTAKCSTDK
jgi:hypothetical protein